MAKELNARERKFVEVYDGNGTEAARQAGYAGDDGVLAVQASRLLRKVEVKEALRARESRETRKGVRTRLERQQFWSRVMDDEGAEMRDRIKASELLGRSEGDFTDKLEVKGELTLEHLVLGSMRKPEGPEV